MSAPGAMALVDVTPRMALFGEMFLHHAAPSSDLDTLPDAHAAVDVVRATVPRTSGPHARAPVFEAAAFLGEWLRARLPGSWVAEGPGEPQLQATDATGSIAYVLPLVSVVRVASTAGYDGLGQPLWSSNEGAAVTVAGGPVGELSVRFNPYLGRYLMTYLDQRKSGIVLREAPRPWGPWSAPVVIASDPPFFRLYGSFMPERFNGKSFYYMMSQGGPYNTFWMQTTLPCRKIFRSSNP